MSSKRLASNKNQVPEGYKKTEIGVIPEDWEIVPITKATSAIFLGLTAKVDYVNSGGIPLIRASDIASGRLKFSDARTISVRQHKELTKYRRPKKEDVLVSKSGSLGVCAIVDVDRDFSIYESIIVIQSNSLLNSNFLLWLVRDERTQIRMIGEKVGSTVGHLNLEMFRKLIIPLPPIPEQKAIAQTLSDVDTLIAALDKLIAKKRNIKTATMQQLLTGKTRLPGFGEGKGYKKTEVGVIPEDWEVDYLGEYAEVTKLAGFEYTNYFNSYRDGGEIIVIRGVNITNNTLNLENVKTIPKATSNKLPRSQLKKNDLVFAYVGTIGPVFLIEQSGKYHLGPNTARITPKNMVIPQFLFFYFKSNLLESEINEKISIGAQPSLSMLKIRSFKIIKPPIPEQQAIAQVLSDIDTEITALEKRRAKTQAIKQGMMQELLTGRTRLINN